MKNNTFAIDVSPYQKNADFVAATQVVRTLNNAGYEAYVVGGTPRDILMGRPFHDVDVATNARPEVVQSLFPQTHIIGASFGVVLTVQDDVPIEVATFRTEGEYLDGRHPANLNYTDSARLDAARRDFTINAFYLNPITGEILDFFQGREHLKSRQLVTVGNPLDRFNEDALRILRAIRFAVRFNLTISDDILAALPSLAPNLLKLSKERIREELNGMLLSPHPSKAIALLESYGLLPLILPEVADLRGCPQPKQFHPEGDVLTHTLLALDQLIAPDLVTLWATLLHDIAKPETLSFDADGVPHAYGHEVAGARLAETILLRLKFDRELIDAVTEVIGNHMRFVHISKMSKAKVRRLLASPNFYAEIQVLQADIMGSHKDLGPWLDTLDVYAQIMDEPQLPPPWITGKDLLHLDLKPGPHFKKILSHMMDRQIFGRSLSRDDALDYLQRRLRIVGYAQ